MAIYPNYQTPFYQPTYQPNFQQQYQPAQNSGITWVQGEAGAKSYLVAPNTTVQLWDSEKQRIYLKSADASGMPSMKILDYTIQDTSGNAPVASGAQNDTTQYITRDELEPLKTQISGLKKQIEKLKKVDDDE